MKSNSLMWLVIAVLVIGGYMWLGQPKNSQAPSSVVTASPSPSTPLATIDLVEQSDLGQSGTAVFSENAGGKLVVTLSLTGGNFTDPQPVHIHAGSCPTPGAVKYPLTKVVDGKSETVLDTTWAAIQSAGEKLALNVHKSDTQARIYTACGDLPISSSN